MRGLRHVAQAILWGANALERGGTRLDAAARNYASLTDGAISYRETIRATVTDDLAGADDETANAVLLVCVDDFDVVVAHRGSGIAEEIRSAITDRISQAIRSGDVVTPFEEDSIIITRCTNNDHGETEVIAKRIADQFRDPIASTAGPLPVTVSIGIATGDGDTRASVSDLRRQARLAARTAQRKGRSQISLFDRADHAHAFENYETERHLFNALDSDQIQVRYQPIVNLHTGDVVGNEALVRWEDDLLGSVSPSIFLPIAEGSGLIQKIGSRVLEAAFAQASRWEQSGHHYITSVNLSNPELLNPELLPMLDGMLERHQLDPQRVWLEISESTVMNDVAASTTILGNLKDRGLKLAIDHFGTGYSSLAYLRRLPVDTLKIDQSFVQSIYSRDDRAIARAIIDLAHTLGMTTVADGVQSRLQIEVLDALNCDMVQGEFLHPAAAAEDLDLHHYDFELPGLNESLGSPSERAAITDPSVQQ